MQPILKNEATAKYRRIPILIFSDTDGVSPWAGSVTGVKAQLSFNGAIEVASTLDIVRVGGSVHYAELTQAESNTDDGFVTARVAVAAGRLEGQGIAYITNYEPRAAGPTPGDIRAEMDANSTGLATLLSADTTYKKNVAVTAFAYYLELTTGLPATAVVVTGTISKDGAAFAALTNASVEIGSGWYKVNLVQAEMNADEVALKFTAAGTKQRNIKIRTQS